MAMRAIQNLNVSLGLMGFSVKVYKATNDPREGVSFRQIHAACGNPINLVKRCHTCNTDVAAADLLKGFQEPDGSFLTFTEAEVKALKPEAAGTLKIDGYVADGSIDAAYLDGTVYFLAPDRGDKKKAPVDTFTTWRDALAGRWALGKVVMAGREHVVAIRAVDKVLALYFVRTTAEIRSTTDIPGYADVPDAGSSSRQYLDLMNQVMDQQTVTFDGVVLESDAYADAVLALVESRRAGQPVPTTPDAPKPSGGDLMAMLQASLKAGKKGAAA